MEIAVIGSVESGLVIVTDDGVPIITGSPEGARRLAMRLIETAAGVEYGQEQQRESAKEKERKESMQ